MSTISRLRCVATVNFIFFHDPNSRETWPSQTEPASAPLAEPNHVSPGANFHKAVLPLSSPDFDDAV